MSSFDRGFNIDVATRDVPTHPASASNKFSFPNFFSLSKARPTTLSITVIKQTLLRRGVLVLCLVFSICEDHTTLAGFFRQSRQGRGKSLGVKRSIFKFPSFRTAPEGKKQREQERVGKKERRIVRRGQKKAQKQAEKDRRRQRL